MINMPLMERSFEEAIGHVTSALGEVELLPSRSCGILAD
jgi:hypothetical protein